MRAGCHLLSKVGKSLKAMSVMALKVPLQKTTVRGPIQSREKARSKVDCMVFDAVIVVMVLMM